MTWSPTRHPTKEAFARLMVWGIVLMAVGYSLSCLTRAYELSPSEISAARKDRQIRQDAEKGLDRTRDRKGRKSGLPRSAKPLDDMQGPIGDEKHKDFLAVYKELGSRPENQGLSERTLADLAERQQKDSPPPTPTCSSLEERQNQLKAKTGAGPRPPGSVDRRLARPASALSQSRAGSKPGRASVGASERAEARGSDRRAAVRRAAQG